MSIIQIKQVEFRDMGHIRYKQAWDLQLELFEEIKDIIDCGGKGVVFKIREVLK